MRKVVEKCRAIANVSDVYGKDVDRATVSEEQFKSMLSEISKEISGLDKFTGQTMLAVLALLAVLPLATLQHAVAVGDKPPGQALNAALELKQKTAVERAGLLRRVAAKLGVSPRTVENLLCEKYRGGTKPLVWCRVGRRHEGRRDAILQRIGAGEYARKLKELL